MPKTLYILRHAKAEAGDAKMRDIDRPLAERGVNDAADLAKWLQAHDERMPQIVGCSSSKRTKQTWAQVKSALVQDVTLSEDDELYLASAGELLQYCQGLDDSHDCVMLIGHNPGLHELVLTLAQADNHPAWEDIDIKFPTCALAIVICAIDNWEKIAPQCGELHSYWDPKKHVG